MNLTDTKAYTKKRCEDGFIPFAFQFRLGLFVLVQNNYRGQEEKSKNHNLAGKLRALGKYVAAGMLASESCLPGLRQLLSTRRRQEPMAPSLWDL